MSVIEIKVRDKVYTFDSWHGHKGLAKARAKSIRAKGLLAVVRERSSTYKPMYGRMGYAVFVRPKVTF